MKMASWCRWLWVAGCITALGACAHTSTPPLYTWGSFTKWQYDTLLRSGSSGTEQISAMEAQAEAARGTNTVLPPGFRAHLGLLKLSAGNPEQARLLWEAEKAAFPESAPYMNQLLKRLSNPSPKDAPA